MNTTFLFILLAFGAVALVGTLVALLRQRAPRVADDPERLAQLRDLTDDREARRLAIETEERIAHQLDAPGNGLAPQLTQPAGPRPKQLADARVWAGAV
jgi:hypothetical protein